MEVVIDATLFALIKAQRGIKRCPGESVMQSRKVILRRRARLFEPFVDGLWEALYSRAPGIGGFLSLGLKFGFVASLPAPTSRLRCCP